MDIQDTLVTHPQVFNFHEFPLRVINQGGEPWFVLTDLCRVLEIKQAVRAATPLDEDEKAVATVFTPGGPQRLTMVSEPGLYRLLMVSRKPQAKPFQRWITHEVLPALRKTGAYSVEERLLERLLDCQERFLERLPAALAPLLAAQRSASPPKAKKPRKR